MISGDKLIKKFIKPIQIGDNTHGFIGRVFIRIHELDEQVKDLESRNQALKKLLINLGQK